MSDIPVKRNHMEIPWHNYVSVRNSQPITEASLPLGLVFVRTLTDKMFRYCT